jgi:hypothetical protein
MKRRTPLKKDRFIVSLLLRRRSVRPAAVNIC